MKFKLFFFFLIITTSAISQCSLFFSKAERQKEKISCSLAIDSITKINGELKDSVSLLIKKNNLLSDELMIFSQQNKKMQELQQFAKIGVQLWQKNNLSVTELSNGKALFYAQTKEEWDKCFKNRIPAYCYHQNDSLKQNGLIYNIYALNSELLAPKGYKIPSKKDVEELIVSFHSLKDSASFFLKSDDQKTWNKKGLDLFDMNIKPYGFRLSDGVDWYFGDKVYYFCKSEMNEIRSLDLYVFSEFSNKIYFLNRNKETDNVNYGLYVRCIIDK